MSPEEEEFLEAQNGPARGFWMLARDLYPLGQRLFELMQVHEGKHTGHRVLDWDELSMGQRFAFAEWVRLAVLARLGAGVIQVGMVDS
jgi:hypothetical protein